MKKVKNLMVIAQKRKSVIVCFVALLLLPIVFLTGCSADIDGRHNGLSIGFNFIGPRYSQIMYAVRSDRTEFEINNVTLDFYCGWFGELPFFHTDIEDEASYTVGVAFYITKSVVGQSIDPQGDYRNVENQHFIKIISAEEFWSESFLANQTRRDGKVFNHSGESITIPKEAFSQQEGTLELYAQIVSFYLEDNLFHFDSSLSGSWYTVYIRYNRVNDNIIRLRRL